jgi:serine/threonine-protein kinase
VTEPRATAKTASVTESSDTGRLIAGRYRLGPVIGRGGMATIHRATDVRLDRQVAVKLLRPDVSADADLAQRFRREALAATVLRHPNIVACLDTGTDDGQPFLVMDLVEGEDLAARLKRGGRLAPHAVARIGLDIARGLGVAHVRGIVHRDIKPGNILLAADGRAMVTDFGIARLAVDVEAAVPGTTLGSVHYFSPEQARGTTTTPASDVYGVGLVLYEALTGARAWTGESTDAIALARVGSPAPSPRAVRPEVPAALDAVVVRALSPDPADRYPNGVSLAAALEPIVAATDPTTPGAGIGSARPAGSTVVVRPADPAEVAAAPRAAQPAARQPAPPGRAAPPARPAQARRRRRWPPAMVPMLAVVGVVAGAMVVAAFSSGDGLAVGPFATPALEEPVGSGTAATAGPTAGPTTEPTTEPSAAPTPEPTPEATPVPPAETAELCDPILGLACSLGAGRYAALELSPGFDLEVGDGWSVAVNEPDLLTLSRQEGLITFVGGATQVFPEGRGEDTRGRVRDLIGAWRSTERVESTGARNVRIDDRRGQSVDVTATGSDRVAAFGIDGNVYYLEPGRLTRLVALDAPGRESLIIAIEPDGRHTLEEILATADDVAASVRFT